MDTRTPDDVMDERLRAAGDRLRATSPPPAATKAALAELRGHPGTLRRLWWVLPTGLIAAAAATIGVLVLAGGPDEAVEEVPAVTPPVTAAPTTPPTAPPTSIAPTTVPAFAGGPPLSASAAALGCAGTLGELADGIDASLHPITALSCSAATAQAVSGDTVIGLRRQEDGTWSEVTRETSSCLPIHCSFQIDLLPVPPAALLERDFGDLPPEDVTPQVQMDAAEVQVSEPAQFAGSLGARLADGQDPAPTVTAEVVEGANVFVITLSGLGDDSIGEVTYLAWYDPSPPVPTVLRAYLISRCSRGVAVDEAGESLDLCL
jgi:hypothetical protein